MISIAQASQRQAAAIARLIMMAMTDECCLHFCGEGRGLRHFHEMMTQLVSRDDSQYSYRNTLVALGPAGADGQPQVVGIAVSYDGGRLHQLRRPFIELARTCLGKDHSAMDDETQAGELYLDSLAVLPHCRRQGIAGRLIEATRQRARQEGLPCVGLLVDEGNPDGQAFYAKAGFVFAGNSSWGGHPMRHLVLPAGETECS